MDVTPPDAKSEGALFGGVTDWYQEPRSWLFQLSQFLRIHQRIAWGHLLDELSCSPILHGRPYRYHLNGPVHMMTARKRVGPVPTHRLVVRHSVDYSSLDHFSSNNSSSDSSSSSLSETSSDSSADALSDSASSRSSSNHSLPASPLGTRSSHRLCLLVSSVHHSSTISKRLSHDSSSASRSHKRSRLPVAYVPLSSPTLEALSYARIDILPSPKRTRSPETATDLEDCSEDRFEPYVPREVGLGVDFENESSEPSRSRGVDLVMDVDVVRNDGIEIDPEIQANIDECFGYADALRDRGIDARVVVEVVDRKESETGTRGPVEVRVERVTHLAMLEDTPEPAQEGAIEVTYETLGDLVQRFHDHIEAIPIHYVQVVEGAQREQGHRIVGAETAVTILTERLAELERDNRRLRGTTSVEIKEEMEMEEIEIEDMEIEETEMEEMEMEKMETEKMETEEIEMVMGRKMKWYNASED
ncbi:hypothetical protein Tco_1058504 [Tanacetum coccineum]|uniref:Uncharacterized protein n=1 Tax=Tanacetum coccineum TaxID=301880 RepID=A0ABQ5HA82_9ASTR